MSTSPLAVPPLNLDARVAQLFAASKRLGYAQVTADLVIVRASPNFHEFVVNPQIPIKGNKLTAVLWEFIGLEDVLINIVHGQTPNYELDCIQRDRTDGTTLYLTLRVEQFDAQKPETGLLVIIEDTTTTNMLLQHLVQSRNNLQLTQMQVTFTRAELEQVNRFKSFLVTTVAHDLRTPISVVNGYAEMLLQDAEQLTREQRQRFTSSILAQTDAMNQILDNFIDFDQIEQGTLAFQAVACNLNEIIQPVINASESYATLRQLHLTFAPTPTNLSVNIAPERIQQVVRSLLQNAFKRTPRGGRVTISTQATPRTALVSVTDTGPVLSDQQISRLFRSLHRNFDSEQSRVVGASMSLLVAKTLTEMHHGTISVTSHPDQGTSLTMTLPLIGTSPNHHA